MQEIKTRFQKRKESTHRAVMNTALTLIEEKGSDTVSMDLIAETADISRATLFNHFHTKGELLVEVFTPLFDDSLRIIQETLADIRSSTLDPLEGIQRVCLYLWETKRIIMISEKNGKSIYDCDKLISLHTAMVSSFELLFEELSKTCTLRMPDYTQSARLIYKTFIPVLEVLGSSADRDSIFSGCLKGLLIDDC